MRLYTIKEIEEIIERTPATIYAYMRIDKETKSFFEEHRQKRKKGAYLYDEEAVERLKNQFAVENAVGEAFSEEESGEILNDSAPVLQLQATIEELSRQNEELQGKLKELQARLDESEEERKKLIDAQGGLLLIIQQEKAEKQLLLPPPSFVERVKRFFKK